MSKRGLVDGQARREEIEGRNDDENEEAGVFSRADSSVVAQRKIVKVRRSAGGANGGGTPGASLNPFAGTTALTSGAAPSANPFAGFGGLTPAAKSGTPASTTTATATTGGISLPADMFKTAVSPKTGSTGTSVLGSGDSSSGSDSPGSKISRLNQSFLTWLEKQAVQCPLGLWQDGCQDYIDSAKAIIGDDSGVGMSVSKPVTDSAPPAGFSFGAANKPVESTSKPAESASPAGFSFGAANKPVESTSKPAESASPAGFSFNIPAASKPADAAPAAFSFNIPAASKPADAAPAAFSFNIPAASKPADAAPAAFSFGAAPAAAPAAGGFSFSAPPAASAAGEDNEEGEDEAEPLLEPEKVLKNDQDTDEVLFEIGSDKGGMKLLRFNAEDKEWKDVGKGSLSLTRPRDSNGTASARILVRNTLGKPTLNTNMFKGMKFEKAGKNGVKFTVVEADKKFVNVIVKVKADQLDSLLKAFNDHIPK